MRSNTPRRLSMTLSAAAGLTLLVSISGCATPAPDPGDAGVGDSTFSVENCGVEQTFDVAPERVVTIKSTSTEMLLALGLGDRIVGTAFSDGPVPDQWADEAADLPVLSEQMPGEEAVLELEPDLVYSGWESAFTPEAAGERDELASLGVASYVQPAACRSTGAPSKLDFDEVFGEIEEAAAIFRADAAPLIAEQRAAVESIVPDERGLSALWYSSGTDTPYVGAGTGAPQLVLDTVGLTNVAGDIEQTWTTLGWEAIVAADPDVIVLIEADWNSVESKVAQLEANPATAQLAAVREKRYLTLPFASSEAGVRTAEAAESLAEQLAAVEVP